MPPTLRLWAASGTEVFRAAYGCQAHSAAITPRASILSRIFSPLFICLFHSKVGNASLADLKERELVRRMSFFDPEGQVPPMSALQHS
jgi:hypothetical protein